MGFTEGSTSISLFPIIFSELHIVIEKLVQLPFQGFHEGFSVQTEFSPFPVEKVAHFLNPGPFYLLTVTFQHLEMTQHLARGFPRTPQICVLPGIYHT